MIRPTLRAALALLAVSSFAAGCSPAGKPVARIGARTLTTEDLLAAARGNEMQYPAVPAEAKKALLQDLVRRELMLEAARARGLDTTTYARQFLATTTDRITLETLYQRLAPQDIGASEGEAKRFYEWRGTKAEAHVIYAPDRPVIQAAAADLAGGQPFAAVADHYNMPGSLPPGGAVGMVSPGSLVPPLDAALRTLKLNAIGGPYETPQGHFLLMVSKREPAERPEYELVQTQLLDMIRQRKTRQVMNVALVALRDAYRAKVEKGAAATLFQLLTPSRVGDAPIPNPSPAERAQVLASWNGGTYTLGDALEDLKRPDIQKPAASMTSAIEQWIQSQVLTRLARAEAKRRHIADEPAVARRIRGEYERYLLEGEFEASVGGVPAPDEALVRQVWDALKGQYQQLERANVQWVIVPDSASAVRLASHGGHGGGTLKSAAEMAGLGHLVRETVVAFPTSDPDWITMRETLARMQPGEWSGPERVAEGLKFFQLVDKVQGELTFEKLTPDMRASLESNAWQMAREQRLAQYTDSLQAKLRPNLYVENLASLPWPPPATIDVGR